MSCPLTPMGANIIVTMDQEGGKEQKSDSGILIAASVKTDGPKTVSPHTNTLQGVRSQCSKIIHAGTGTVQKV